jgi:DNA (cytosine-5)-methyltransferase 1
MVGQADGGISLNHLDLFSGIGGFALAAKWSGFETVGFCEINKFCQKVLRKNWPKVPIHSDIKDLSVEEIKSTGVIPEIITGGFPCQPYSIAGKRGGKEDNRSLWPEMLRIIRGVEPAWVIAENVRGIVSMELDQVLIDLEDSNYSTESFIIPACAVEAPHRRDRVWVVANSNSKRLQVSKQEKPQRTGPDDTGEAIAERAWRSSEPGILRVAYGIPGRVDRLKSLGNAVVPLIPHRLYEIIKMAELQ